MTAQPPGLTDRDDRAGFPGVDNSDVAFVEVDADGVRLSALVCAVSRPRAVVLALHGGASHAVYWDGPGQPRSSLLRIGAALGFTVVALDRPGYGSSFGHSDHELGPGPRRVDLVHAALDQLLTGRSRGAGLFVIGHSIGCELALRVAADERRGPGLLGLEIAGTGREHHPAVLELVRARHPQEAALRRPRGLRDLLWQPPRIYPPEMIGGSAISASSPQYEADVADHWAARDFPGLAARVRIPVHITLGEYEAIWRSGPPALDDLTQLFSSAPRVSSDEQVDGGHNLSVGLNAAAYHLKVLSFVEECVVEREIEGRTG